MQYDIKKDGVDMHFAEDKYKKRPQIMAHCLWILAQGRKGVVRHRGNGWREIAEERPRGAAFHCSFTTSLEPQLMAPHGAINHLLATNTQAHTHINTHTHTRTYTSALHPLLITPTTER